MRPAPFFVVPIAKATSRMPLDVFNVGSAPIPRLMRPYRSMAFHAALYGIGP